MKLFEENKTNTKEKTGLNYLDQTNLDFADTEHLITGTSVPENNAEYALRRFVEDGPVTLEHFSQALENASEVWREYLKKDDHHPRKVSEREASVYGAGGAGAAFLTNSPKYSKEVRKQVEEYKNDINKELGEIYDDLTIQSLASSLLGPEEKAQAELIIRD